MVDSGIDAKRSLPGGHNVFLGASYRSIYRFWDNSYLRSILKNRLTGCTPPKGSFDLSCVLVPLHDLALALFTKGGSFNPPSLPPPFFFHRSFPCNRRKAHVQPSSSSLQPSNSSNTLLHATRGEGFKEACPCHPPNWRMTWSCQARESLMIVRCSLPFPLSCRLEDQGRCFLSLNPVLLCLHSIRMCSLDLQRQIPSIWSLFDIAVGMGTRYRMTMVQSFLHPTRPIVNLTAYRTSQSLRLCHGLSSPSIFHGARQKPAVLSAALQGPPELLIGTWTGSLTEERASFRKAW